MGIAEGLLALLLVFGGGYTYGYVSKEDKQCKRINSAVPNRLLEDIKINRCVEKKTLGVCNKKILPPRFILDKENYYKLKTFSQERKLYLNANKSVIDEYNKDPYVEK